MKYYMYCRPYMLTSNKKKCFVRAVQIFLPVSTVDISISFWRDFAWNTSILKTFTNHKKTSSTTRLLVKFSFICRSLKYCFCNSLDEIVFRYSTRKHHLCSAVTYNYVIKYDTTGNTGQVFTITLAAEQDRTTQCWI